MNAETEKSFHPFSLRKPETTAMFFPVPRRTASRLTLLMHFGKSERSFGMQARAMPLVGIAPSLPVFFLSPVRRRALFCMRRRVPASTWENALSLRGAPCFGSVFLNWLVCPHSPNLELRFDNLDYFIAETSRKISEIWQSRSEISAVYQNLDTIAEIVALIQKLL